MATLAPYHIDIAPWFAWKSTTYTMTRTNNSSALMLGYVFCNASNTTGKHVEWDVAMAAGTWTLTIIYLKGHSAAIVTPSLAGTDLSTVDTYNGTTTFNNVSQITGIVVASAGTKELKFRTDSKNAGADGYDFFPQWITLTRTGA